MFCRASASRFMGLLVGSVLALQGCSHAPPTGSSSKKKPNPQALLKLACYPGTRLESVKGAAWLKAKSKDASGQFPALIQVAGGASPTLHLEITKPLGGTYAILRVQGTEYTVDVPSKQEQNRSGRDSWGGIPLVWATDLFLGRIPCPKSEVQASSRLSIGPEGELIVEAPEGAGRKAEKFVYRFKSETRADGKRLWPESLSWSSSRQDGQPLSVEFRFDDPEERSWSPLKWEATSPFGEIKVKWREREPVLIPR